MSIIDTDKVIRLVDIATMAGVGPSAVSNWRRRHDDFPKPVAVFPRWGALGRDLELFNIDQVTDWLDAREEKGWLNARDEILEAQEKRLEQQLAKLRARRRQS